jgi:hypothetical protein
MREIIKHGIAVGLILLGCSIGHASEGTNIVVQAGVQQTPNSNYGNGGEYVVRYEHPIYGDLNVGLEGAYHGATSHNSDTGTYYQNLSITQVSDGRLSRIYSVD